MSTQKNTIKSSSLAKQITAKAAPETTETPRVATAAAPERVFNVYKSTMQAHKLIRQDGKVCHITDGRYVTDDAADIEFIDAEIAAGFQYLRLDKQMTAEELDPIATLKKTLKEEAKEELLQELQLSGVKLNPLSTSALSAASSSDSGAK